MFTENLQFIDTRSLAKMLGGIKPHTIHKSHCLRGHYNGLVPKKLQNGRLIWNVNEVNALLNK